LIVVSLLLAGLASACARVADRDFIAETMREGSFGEADARKDSLVVASYNIQYGQNVDQAIEDLRSDPWCATADILLLQEMGPDGTETMARELGYDFVYYPATRHPEHDLPFGNAVLSRATILQHYFIALPVKSPFPVTSRIAVVAQIDIQPEPVVAVSLHSSTVVVSREIRLEQFESVRDSLEAFEGVVVIGGDFNTPTYDDVRLLRARMRESQYLHARPPSATAHLPRWQQAFDVQADLDHFFFKGLRLRRNGVATEASASDHLPVWAVFEWSD
jgi:endonuclease/exonuclease/phosphatase family metal-dependent hydrolase